MLNSGLRVGEALALEKISNLKPLAVGSKGKGRKGKSLLSLVRAWRAAILTFTISLLNISDS